MYDAVLMTYRYFNGCEGLRTPSAKTVDPARRLLETLHLPTVLDSILETGVSLLSST